MTEIHVTPKGGWQPQPGETITGVIVDIDVAEGAYGAYPVVDVQTDDARIISVHAFHDGLRSKLKLRGAQVGEKVSITYRGRAGEGVGTDAYLYDVLVGAEPMRFDFDTLSYTKGAAVAPAGEKAEVSDGATADVDGSAPF